MTMRAVFAVLIRVALVVFGLNLLLMAVALGFPWPFIDDRDPLVAVVCLAVSVLCFRIAMVRKLL